MKRTLHMLSITFTILIVSTIFIKADNTKQLSEKWIATEAIIEDEEGNRASIGMDYLGTSMEMTFIGDEVILELDGEVETGNYELIDNHLIISSDGESITLPIKFITPYKLELDLRTIIGENILFILEQKKKNIFYYQSHPITSIDNLNGKWEATEAILCDEEGNKITASMAFTGITFKMSFNDEYVSLSMDNETEKGTYQLIDELLIITIDNIPIAFPIKVIDSQKFEMDLEPLMNEKVTLIIEKSN